MSFYSKIRGTIETILQLGLGGPQLKNNSGVIEARNATDAGFVVGRGADPVAANDWVNLESLNSAAGVSNVIRYALGTGATQDSTKQIPANAIVMRARISITTPYSGGATISLGQPGGLTLLMAITDLNPQQAGLYEVPQDTVWGGSPLVVRATVAGAPGAGIGVAIVEYSIPNS